MGKKIRVGLIGCGVIGGFVFDALVGGKIDEAKLVVICQRSERPAEKNKALAHGIRWVTKAEENVPVPANPKTTYLACLSVLAALKNVRSPYRVGT